MSALIFNQLAILLWKSWITRRRHWISTIFELLTPLLLSLLVAYIYAKGQEISSQLSADMDTPELVTPTHKPSSVVPPTIFKRPTISMTFGSDVLFTANVIYGPSTPETDDIMRRIKDGVSFGLLRLTKVETPDLVNAKMESLVSNEDIDQSLVSITYGVIFDDKSLSRNSLNYTIRQIGGMSSIVNKLFPSKYFPGPTDDVPAYTQHFCNLQILINNAFIDRISATSEKPRRVGSIGTFRFPFPSYKKRDDDQKMFSIQDLIAATIAIGYVVMCPLIVKRITDEKVAKAKEMMRMIGMSDWVFWLSHFISYFTILLFHCIVFTVLYCSGLGGDPIIFYSNTFLFFLLLVIYSAQTILFCMTLTTVFNRPVLAVIVTVILWIVSYAVPIGVLNPIFHQDMDITATNGARILSVLLPNMGLSWALAVIGQYEVMGTGAKLTTMFSQTSVYGQLTLGLVLTMMLLSCLLYITLIWYLDNVWPFQYGVPKPLCFPFSMTYWFPSKYRDIKKQTDSDKTDLVIDTRNFEREPDTPVTIMIKNLRKDFGGFGTQRKTAVNNLSLNIYDRQITALLGHNGAGKTTTMNMITGIFPPSSGTVHVDGYDIQTETNKARRSIGLCPQVGHPINYSM